MRTAKWSTKIADTSEDAIVVRGYDLTDLIGRLTFGEMFYLLTRGEIPDKQTGRMVDAMLVALADHGIITTSVVSRYAIASGTPLQGALAAGLLMIGDIYAGAVEQAARFLHETLLALRGGERDDAIRGVVDDYRKRAERIPGYGHPLHPSRDPRSARLVALARELGVAGEAVSLALSVERALASRARRPLPLNADGAIAAIALDLGFDWWATRSFVLLSRASGILAHSLEERSDGTPWRLPPPSEYEVKAHEAYYQGPPPRRLPAERA